MVIKFETRPEVIAYLNLEQEVIFISIIIISFFNSWRDGR